eukprot:6992638-Alexandrium_andersonii.AAC.1
MLATCGRIRRHHADYAKAATDPALAAKFVDIWVDQAAWLDACVGASGEALGACKLDAGDLQATF